MGFRWRRLGTKTRLYFIKLFRQEGTPECIARGAALGLFAAFLVPIGLHTVILLLLGFLFRANKITAMGVTFMISNEFTIPFIYTTQCIIGSYVIMDPLTLHDVTRMLAEFYADFSWSSLDRSWAHLIRIGKEVGLPFFAGGAVIAAITMPPGYFMALSAANKLRARREQRKLLKEQKKQAAQAAGQGK